MKKYIPCLFLVWLLVSIGHAESPALSYAGGDGSSFEKAVLIKNATEETGVKAEYAYLDKHFPRHSVEKQSLQEHKGRMYDVLEIGTPEGKKEVYFDITEFFGKN